MSIPFGVNCSRESDSRSDTIRGKIESARITSSAGQMKTLCGARIPADGRRRRPADDARDDSRPDPEEGIGPRGSTEEELLALDSKARLVGRELGVTAFGVGDLLP